MTVFLVFLAALLLAFAGFALWVRIAPTDPGVWHVEPASAPDPSTPNFARVDRMTSLSPDETAAAITAQAQAEGAGILAGDWPHVTFIARTRLMAYPDFVSIRLNAVDGGTQVIAFSRSRFGYGDAGVNRARLRRWIGRLPQ